MLSTQVALRVFGAVFMIRALVATIHPHTFGSVINYPPAPKAEKAGFMGIGSKALSVVGDKEENQVMVLAQFYGLAQSGLSSVAITAARAADPYTMSVAAVSLGLTTITFSAYGYFAVKPLQGLLDFEMTGLLRLLVPYCLLGAFLIYVGLPGLSASRYKQPIGKSGTMMKVVSAFGMLQGFFFIFFTDAWMARFGVPDVHETTRAVTMFFVPMWGICIVGGALSRIAVVRAGHTASIYACNRSLAVYYAMLTGALAVAKTYGDDASASAMTTQTYVAFAYFSLTYFAGTVADDAAAVTKKKK